MKKYLNKGVKSVTTEFPQVGNILDEYGIGCVTCSVGTCMLKDVIEIHNLPGNQEIDMMKRIERVIYPGRETETPDSEAAEERTHIVERTNAVNMKYSPPIKKLVDEHVKIKSFIGLIPKICKIIEGEPEIDRSLILNSIDFIRTYADKFHHAKEEDILFKYVDDNQDIIKVMLEDHKTARSTVNSILEGMENHDKPEIVRGFKKYAELLTQHIKKEDEILYPWIDRNLSISRIGGIFEKFNAVDETMGTDISDRYDRFIKNLEQRV